MGVRTQRRKLQKSAKRRKLAYCKSCKARCAKCFVVDSVIVHKNSAFEPYCLGYRCRKCFDMWSVAKLVDA